MHVLKRAAVIAAVACAAAPSAAFADHGKHHFGGSYRQVNLVSDQPGMAQLTDSNLKNAWGLAAGPRTPLWVADNGTDKATVYRGGLKHTPIATAIPPVDIPGGEPTGQVFNGSGAFAVSDGMGHSGSALFLFASEAGNIVGWNPATGGQIAVHNGDAVYKGLALADRAGQPTLYASDFHNGRVDVFDSAFHPVATSGGFADPGIPSGFAPFGIQAIGSSIIVTYAKQDADRKDDVAGPGNGFVDQFTTDGTLIRRLASRGTLDSPWGVVQAPSGFGAFSHALLIGNFGDGRINGFRRHRFLGQLQGRHGPITIDGLWGLRFGNGITGTPRTLLFSAGPDDEAHGLLGELTKGRI